MQSLRIKWSLFVLIVSIAHFWAVTYVVGMLNIFANPLWIVVIGVTWVLFAMPPITTWLVINTPFRRVYHWARS